MSQENNKPVVVTGDEKRHPAIRILARACIALARLRSTGGAAAAPVDGQATQPAAERKEVAADD